MWRHTAIVSTLILISVFAALILAVACLPLLNTGIEQNGLLPWSVIMLGIGSLFNHIAAVEGLDMLSQKTKPLLTASLNDSITTEVAVGIGGYLYSTDDAVLGYAVAITNCDLCGRRDAGS